MLQELFMAASILTGASAQFGRTVAGTAAYPQTFIDELNPIKYTANMGPYSQRPGVGLSPELPEGCEVEQVVLFARSGASYPAAPEVTSQKKVLEGIFSKAPKTGFVGSLSFLNDYEYFLKDEGYANLEVASGPYSGLAGSTQFGAEFAGVYGHLWNEEIIPIFSDNIERDLDTARAFGQGFLGYNYSKSASINIYPTLQDCPKAQVWTTCPVLRTNETNGTIVPENSFRYPAFEIAALRLNEENSLNLTVEDVFVLMNLASYEITVTGSSPWTTVFTTEEWVAFEYSYDVYFDCFFGSQSPRAKAIGALFVKQAAEVLKAGPEDALALSLVFGKDIDLTSILAALDLATPSRLLRPNKITFDKNFRVTDVAPSGGRLVIERIVCKAPGLTNDTDLTGATNSTKPLWNPNWTDPQTNFSQWYPNITILNGTGANGTNSSAGATNSTAGGTNGTVSGGNATYPNATYPNATAPNVTSPNATYPDTISPNTTQSNGTYHNGTSGGASGSNSTSGGSGGAVWQESPETATNTTFIRFILNDAVVPWDACYDGPGFSCSLDDFVTLIETKVKVAQAAEICGTQTVDFLTNYNTSTSLNYATSDIPYQAIQVSTE